MSSTTTTTTMATTTGAGVAVTVQQPAPEENVNATTRIGGAASTAAAATATTTTPTTAATAAAGGGGGCSSLGTGRLVQRRPIHNNNNNNNNEAKEEEPALDLPDRDGGGVGDNHSDEPDGLMFVVDSLHDRKKYDLDTLRNQKYDVNTWSKVEPQYYKRKPKSIRRFYKQQNQLIDNLQAFYKRHYHNKHHRQQQRRNSKIPGKEDDDLEGRDKSCSSDDDDEDAEEEEEHHPRPVAIAIHASFGLNVVLLLIKILASVLSGSMSVIASAADSLLDLLSGSVLVITHKLVQSRRTSDSYRYPQGKSRIEPIGVFAFAIIMMLSSFQVMIEAIRRFFGAVEIDIGPVTLSILAFTILSKAFMSWYCRRVSVRYRSGAAAAYADDHRNDVLTNTVGVGAALTAFYVPRLWFLDSMGAICIALYIIVCWLHTGNEQLNFLTGRGASPMLLQQLTYIAANHDPRIKFVDTVRAYHFGVNYLVEVDIVLPETMSLQESHDIGESLQHRLEQFEDVERAFVHNDYEWDHSPVVFRGTRIIRK